MTVGVRVRVVGRVETCWGGRAVRVGTDLGAVGAGDGELELGERRVHGADPSSVLRADLELERGGALLEPPRDRGEVVLVEIVALARAVSSSVEEIPRQGRSRGVPPRHARARAPRLGRDRLVRRAGRPGIVGINVGANKDSEDRIADYVAMTRVMAPLASYLAVNISSPNTPGLRALQDEGALTGLLDAVIEARGTAGPPVFLKVAPDLESADIDAIARIALDRNLGALIVSNTTISRPALLSANARETGGLSGAPLRDLAQQRLRDFRKATGGAIPLVGVGGIASAEDAWARIRAGASLVQLYSAMVYGGPGLPRRILRGLEALMRRDGFASIAEAVGSE